jgi:hypothetical protein
MHLIEACGHSLFRTINSSSKRTRPNTKERQDGERGGVSLTNHEESTSESACDLNLLEI